MAETINQKLYYLPDGQGITLGNESMNFTGYQEANLQGVIDNALSALQKYKALVDNPPAHYGEAQRQAAINAFNQYGGQSALDALTSYQSGQPLTQQQAQYLSQGLGGNVDANSLMQFSQNQSVPSGYSMWNGALVQTSQIPELEKQGATVDAQGNVIGAPISSASFPEGSAGQDLYNQIQNGTVVNQPTGPQTTQTGGATGGTMGEVSGSTGTSYIDELMKSDPFLAEQLKDPALRAKFSAWPAELQGLYLQTLNAYKKQIETGNIINPDIDIEPSKIAEFLQQAQTEIDPYYKEVMGNYKKDLEISFGRLQEDYNKSVGRAEEPFKQGLANQAEDEAQSGTAFSSGRVDRERTAIQNQQFKLDDAANNAAQSAQDMATDAERKLGSRELSGLNIPGFNTYQAGTEGFNQAGTRSLFSPQGALLGDIPKARTVDLSQRASDLETDYRKTRILNVSPLGY